MRARRLACALLAWVLAAPAPAQANADDKVVGTMIARAFPEADSTRRIRRDVGVDARRQIEQRLPFKVHFNELGQHTLFVAFRGRRPVGVVYIRSEETEWGLMDIAWALSLDLRVQGFQFLSGRGEARDRLGDAHFAEQLTGLDYQHILAWLQSCDAGDTTLPAGTEQLARIVVRSAAKALAVADVVWRDQVEKLQDTAVGFDAFPSASRFPCQSGAFELAVGDHHETVTVKIVGARTNTNFNLGSVLRTETRLAGKTVQLDWIVDAELRVRHVAPPTDCEDRGLRLACLGLAGQPLDAPRDHENPLAPLARSLADLVRARDRR